jgi:hypothetical protein
VNHCTTARTYLFDNCERLALCDKTALDAAFITSVAHDSPGSPPVATTPAPTVRCADASPHVIYVTGSREFAPLVRAVQVQLYRGVPGYTAVFAPRTSCVAAAAIYDPSPAKHVITNSPDDWAYYFDTSGNQVNCLLHDAGDTVDLGESDVDPALCGYGPTSNVVDYIGPVLTMSLVVPQTSTQMAISAEAAHLAFAAGGHADRGVKPPAPWTDPSRYFVGGPDGRQLVSAALGVDPAHWWGTAAWIDMMPTDPIPNPESAIGLRSATVVDKNRVALRTLAFESRGQSAAYLPDSTPTQFDRLNVRDGHYPLWSATHLMTRLTDGAPGVAGALVVQLVEPKPDLSVLNDVINAGFVPLCAMKVSHSLGGDPDEPAVGGELQPFEPAVGCGCVFDSIVTGTTACRACVSSADCPRGTMACTFGNCPCNYGYCEADGG